MTDEQSQASGPHAPATPAQAQQHALEQDLRIAELQRTVEHLGGERAALREEIRALQSRVGLGAVRAELRRAAKARVAALRGLSPAPAPTFGYPLAALALNGAGEGVRWESEVDILGDVRPALLAEPPVDLHWTIDLVPGTVLSGAATLRPGAWLENHGGVDLIVELSTLDGEPVEGLVVAIDPTAHETQRQWVPWRLPLTGSGPHRLTIRTRVAAGASPDYAWLVIADPRFEIPGLEPREPALRAEGAAVSRHGETAGRLAPFSAGRGSRARRDSAAEGPVIALLLPVHNPDPGLLDRTLASVERQTSARWELCITDDGSTDQVVRDRLARAALDPRVRVVRHETAKGISAATNAAMGLATAEFVATLDHDDVLAPDAIAAISAVLAADPATDFVYTDNDIMAGGRRFSAALKPDWSPDLLRSVMYTLHLSAYRRALVEEIGGWRSAFDGAQDHDLVLRLAERTDRIRHLSKVLYHWRAHAGSAALGELAKPLAYDRGCAAIAEHLARTGARASVERLPEAGRYRVRYERSRPVSLVAAVRGDAADAGLDAVITALLGVLRPGDELLLVGVGDAGVRAAEAARAGAGDERVRAAGAAGHAATNGTSSADGLGRVLAVASELAPGRTAVLMERAVTPATDDAIDTLAGHVEGGAAAAGGVITDPGGRLICGGLAFPQGLPVPLHPGADLNDPARHPDLTMASNRLAVRGVVALSPERIAAWSRGAVDGALAVASVVLAASDDGGRVVWTPHARFIASSVAATALETWPLGAAVALDRGARPDPFWNPQRWADRGDATIPESVHGNPLLDVVDA